MCQQRLKCKSFPLVGNLIQYPWHYWVFGGRLFPWIAAIIFKILARAAEKSLRSINRLGVVFCLLV